MQINNYYLSPLGVSPTEGKSTVDAAGNAVNPEATDLNSHTLSPELLRLIHLVGQDPELRTDVVQQVQDRFAQGVYLLPTSAEQTAEAILKAND